MLYSFSKELFKRGTETQENHELSDVYTVLQLIKSYGAERTNITKILEL